MSSHSPAASWHAPRSPAPWRHLASRALRRASRGLSRLARALAARPHAALPAAEPVLEFYAEAGAPEGALYVDGELVARLPVGRL